MTTLRIDAYHHKTDRILDEDDTEWMSQAACAGMNTNDFYPENAGTVDSLNAQLVCWRCPVRTDCLAYALRHNETGIWGGYTQPQRQREMRTTS